MDRHIRESSSITNKKNKQTNKQTDKQTDKQNKTKQNKTKQNKTKQNKTNQTKPNQTKPNQTKPKQTKPNQTKTNKQTNTQTPVGTGVLGTHPRRAPAWGGAQGGSWSNPPNWTPNGGVQGEPCTERYWSTCYIRPGPTRTSRARQRRPFTMRGRDECPPRGANTAPLRGAFPTPCFSELVVSLNRDRCKRARQRLVRARE